MLERVMCVSSLLVVVSLLSVPCVVSAFVAYSPRPTPFQHHDSTTIRHTTRVYGFGNMFQDMLKDAFDNDSNLSSDKSIGQLDSDDLMSTQQQQQQALTRTQLQWRDANPKRGAPIRSSNILENTAWDLDLFLAGVPSKDPSNDLFGSKTNISSRDRTVGLDVPSDASVTVRIHLLPGGVCKASKTPFTDGTVGQWRLSDNGRELRISIYVLGYTRTVQTKGTITKVFWSKDDEVTTQTSSSYNIPPGWIYGDVTVEYGATPGTFNMDNGVLRVEQTMGLLGASSKMVPCGRFNARSVEQP